MTEEKGRGFSRRRQTFRFDFCFILRYLNPPRMDHSPAIHAVFTANEKIERGLEGTNSAPHLMVTDAERVRKTGLRRQNGALP